MAKKTAKQIISEIDTAIYDFRALRPTRDEIVLLRDILDDGSVRMEDELAAYDEFEERYERDAEEDELDSENYEEEF